MLPKDLLEQQANWKSQTSLSDERAETEKSIYLHVKTLQCEFLIPVLEVLEVSDHMQIRGYPDVVQGHLGIVNLRGNIIPVISVCQRIFFPNEDAVQIQNSELKNAQRMIVMNHPQGHQFAIVSETVKKVVISRDKSDQSNTVSLNGDPVRLINAQDFVSKDLP